MPFLIDKCNFYSALFANYLTPIQKFLSIAYLASPIQPTLRGTTMYDNNSQKPTMTIIRGLPELLPLR